MARNRGSEKQSGNDAQSSSGASKWRNRNPVRWVNGYLNKDDIEWLVANDKHINDLVLEFIDALSDAASLSCKYEASSDKYLAAVVFTGDGDPNDGWACSMRGSNRVDALYALAYVVAEKYKWKLGTAGDDTSNGRWG